MIPRAFITAWRAKVPWGLDEQVEQDLVISRALVAIFSDPIVSSTMALRGGTALQKLHFHPPERYSEDIDLVQIVPGPIGGALRAIRAQLDPWLGLPVWKQGDAGVTLTYRFEAETQPIVKMRLKVEINTREHFTVRGLVAVPFAVDSRWYSGSTEVATYTLEELLGTKLRALYQRRKGRDLFDLCRALKRQPPADAHEIVRCFKKYMDHEGRSISRADFDRNLAAKRIHPQFLSDISRLLPARIGDYDTSAALDFVSAHLISLLS